MKCLFSISLLLLSICHVVAGEICVAAAPDEYWVETKEKLIDAVREYAQISLKCGDIEVNVTPNGYEFELSVVVATDAELGSRPKKEFETELKKLRFRSGYAIYHAVYLKSVDIDAGVSLIRTICRQSTVPVDGYVLMLWIDDDMATRSICEVIRQYRNALLPMKKLAVLLMQPSEQDSEISLDFGSEEQDAEISLDVSN